MPLALKAVISLSDESRPKAMMVATSTAIGIASASMKGKLNTKICVVVQMSRCFVIMRLSRSSTLSSSIMKVITMTERTKGPACSLRMYFDNIFIERP